MDSVIAKVAVENTAFGFDKEYDYLIPVSMIKTAQPGCRVTVFFGSGRNKRVGIITKLCRKSESIKLKSIEAVLDEAPLLNDEMLSVMYWLKERTFCTLFEAAKAILPTGINYKRVISYSLSGIQSSSDILLSNDEKKVLEHLFIRKKYVKREVLLKAVGLTEPCDIPDNLVRRGLLTEKSDSVLRVGDQTEKMVSLISTGQNDDISSVKLTESQKAVIDFLHEAGNASVKEICYFTGHSKVVIKSLIQKKLIELYENPVYRKPHYSAVNGISHNDIELTDEQQTAFSQMYSRFNNGKSSTFLLFGITGSGKTMVYLKLIDNIIIQNKTVIVMVPEIALTPQTLSLFSQRYGEKIAVFHSALSMGERADEWKRVKKGEVSIVVGTRSAVFAPLENIGLIIIDEEQEHTYKSEQTPRYNAKDLARFRCSKHHALLVLSSATPSIESYAAAQAGKYLLCSLTTRYGSAILPEVLTVDMRSELIKGNNSDISGVLLEALRQNIIQGRQSILLINRRGYNTFAACKSCGKVIGCPSCSISMRYHNANKRLMCHYCGYSQPFTVTCSNCGKKDVRYSGFGTQKIEDEITELLPQAKILRMDTDTTMSRLAHETKFEQFRNMEFDIMLGTQMVAKGLDFENVTLAGVISIDQQLYNDDYKSMESAFGLLTQVVGRSGRGRFAGKAVIQTFTPENEIIRLAAKQDYKAFFETEIQIRKLLTYPPYCDICVIGFSAIAETRVKSAASFIFDEIIKKASGDYCTEKLIVLGPVPARIVKVSNRYRYRIIVKCHNTSRFRQMINELLIEYNANREYADVAVYIDINPNTII